jgi:hypothetical protein
MTVVVMARWRRDIHSGVPSKEADWLQGEASVLDRHDGPILGPWIMGHGKRVPDNHVLPIKWAIS